MNILSVLSEMLNDCFQSEYRTLKILIQRSVTNKDAGFFLRILNVQTDERKTEFVYAVKTVEDVVGNIPHT